MTLLFLNRCSIAAYADRLLAAESLVLIYPVWNEGFPAILKGFFDRVFIPGSASPSARTAQSCPTYKSYERSLQSALMAPRVASVSCSEIRPSG